jgi:hypothetical protein
VKQQIQEPDDVFRKRETDACIFKSYRLQISEIKPLFQPAIPKMRLFSLFCRIDFAILTLHAQVTSKRNLGPMMWSVPAKFSNIELCTAH